MVIEAYSDLINHAMAFAAKHHEGPVGLGDVGPPNCWALSAGLGFMLRALSAAFLAVLAALRVTGPAAADGCIFGFSGTRATLGSSSLCCRSCMYGWGHHAVQKWLGR